MDNKNNRPIGIIRLLRRIVIFVYEKLSHLFDRIIFNRTGSILVSLIAATAICVGIDYEEFNLTFLNDNTTTVQINNIEVETLYDDDLYNVSGIPETVSISLTGSSADIQLYRKQDNIKVVADLRDYADGDVIIDLKIKNLPTSLSGTVEPETVTAIISKRVKKDFTITTELLVSSNQKTSDFESPTLDTTTVQVTGSQEEVDSIRTVKAIVDASGHDSDFETTCTLVAYDVNGSPVDVTFEPDTVEATVKLKDSTSE